MVAIEIVVVTVLVVVALGLFVLEPVPIDVTAVGLLVALVVLEPYTGVTPADGISGFANPATVTVLAMFMLSEGVRRTGAVQLLVDRIAALAAGNRTRTQVALLGLAGPLSGFVNSTPVVAVLIPATTDLARKADTSPSSLLLPLSYAAMLGGTLTLIGTSSTLLASDIWARSDVPGSAPFSMFEFVELGAIVLVVGLIYLLTVGRLLTPDRVPASDDLGESFGMAEYLTDVVIEPDSPVVGTTIDEFSRDRDLTVLELVRDGRVLTTGLSNRRLQAGDVLAIRADRENVIELIDDNAVRLLPEVAADPPEGETEAALSEMSDLVQGETAAAAEAASDSVSDRDETAVADDRELVEIVLLPGTRLTGRPLGRTGLEATYDVTVLAVRRGSRVVHARMQELELQAGDTLLAWATPAARERLSSNRELVVSGGGYHETYDRRRIPVALGILAVVVGIAAAGLLPIVIAALAGVVAMIVTGCLRATEAYEAVNWDVIFLLAGVIPLGVAITETGAAAAVADLVTATAGVLPAIGVLTVIYLVTAVLTNVVSNNASVVLLVPVAIDVALRIDANPFAFVLGVTFAAATAFLTPVGYQTNLMVYGPGGYRFADFARVGAPLQLLLAGVVTVGIAAIWGL